MFTIQERIVALNAMLRYQRILKDNKYSQKFDIDPEAGKFELLANSLDVFDVYSIYKILRRAANFSRLQFVTCLFLSFRSRLFNIFQQSLKSRKQLSFFADRLQFHYVFFFPICLISLSKSEIIFCVLLNSSYSAIAFLSA